MAVDPVVVEGATSTISWTFDDPSGYSLYVSGDGTFEINDGKLRMKELTPQGALSPVNIFAYAWSVNQDDDDSAKILQTVAGETVDGGPAYDATSTGTVAMKIRGECAGATKNANEVMRSAGTASNLQIHVWRMYANSQGTATSRNAFIGTWTNTTTPQMGILWDPNDGTLPNTFILASGGVSAWPSFNTEESSGISRTTDQWIFVLMAGRLVTIGATDYYTRVIVMNSTVVKKEINITSVRTVPTGGRFGCKIMGDYADTPAYFDSYKTWENARYPSVVQVLGPRVQPKSLRSVTSYTLATDSGVDIGGSVYTFYRVSLDGGRTFGDWTDIDDIASEVFNGEGDDVIEPLFVLVSDGTTPLTDTFGLFSPSVSLLELTFIPLWVEVASPITSWAEVT